MKLQNKSCIVTGAGSGIGRAIALEFLTEGALVAAVDIRADWARETLALAGAPPERAFAIEADVAAPDAAARLVDQTVAAFGGLHVLVNNAAIAVSKPVEQTTFEEWRRQMDVNVGGVFLCTRSALPHLRKTRGAIVNLASVNGYFVEPYCAGYCATKAAIIAFTKAVAIDHGREGIRCNCICPGYIDAGLAEAYFQSQPDPDAARANAGNLHALGRVGQPREVARAAVYLAGDDSSFVTGSMLVVDGGFGSGLPVSA